jgi:hypothetical protein
MNKDNRTARQRFLSYIADPNHSRPVISPFLPDERVVAQALQTLGEQPIDDNIANEIRLAALLDYEPMFMSRFHELIFPWQVDEELSTAEHEVSIIPLAGGNWTKTIPRKVYSWNDDVPCPVQTEKDHFKLIAVCERVADQTETIRTYFRDLRARVGDNGVIVAGHPHPSWLGYQINPQTIYYHYHDFPKTFQKSMQALYEASLFVIDIAIKEGLDFISDSSYGLEMTSPALFLEMDLPWIQKFSEFAHERNCLFWYHNCGFTSELIKKGYFNRMGADVIETLASPPEGDNDLAESRRHLQDSICSKGNFPLTLLRDGTVEQVEAACRFMVDQVKGSRHIFSTADAVLQNTPPENYIALVRTLRHLTDR